MATYRKRQINASLFPSAISSGLDPYSRWRSRCGCRSGGCAHSTVAMGRWCWPTLWMSGCQDGVALWVMRASPVGERWA